ncbi:hypothetical protein [Actinoplanes sp. NBRC 103695]|uniref:hypothetical protein n=1 Tax=Actinoplanes sp. NBRC 103695 TaxID=3032202 RepID=UPI0024A02E64|nr:hypothetical protein [Actinoplanes sp. NBRC 103695]GLY94499.1 hypothetical protein Acsp02_17550 [Actinoplanes sp. NBRC 103695]
MTGQRQALFLVGHPLDDAYEWWLRKRLAYAKVRDVTEVTVDGSRGDAYGVWGSLPCRVTHLDHLEGGPLFIAAEPAAFDAAMRLPPATRHLPPPLSAFAEACEDLRPSLALLPTEPLSDPDREQWARAAAERVEESAFAEVLDLPCTAVQLNGFGVVLLDEAPAVRTVPLAHGGAVYLTGWTA